MLPGRHKSEFIDPRYEEVSTTADVAAGKATNTLPDAQVSVTCEERFRGTAHRECDGFAAVYINDKFYGYGVLLARRNARPTHRPKRLAAMGPLLLYACFAGFLR